MKLLIVLLLILLSPYLHAQRLKTGDTLPELSAVPVINQPDSFIQIGKTKGELLIMNFWNLACGTATNNFGQIDSLQKQYSGTVRFLHINQESADSTMQFFKELHHLQIPEVPVIAGGRSIWKLFSDKITPFQVWVLDGKIQRITHTYNLSARRIEDILEARNPVMVDLSRPELNPVADRQHAIKYSSFLTTCLEGVNIGNRNGVQVDNAYVISITCVSAKSMFLQAFKEKNRYGFKTSKELMIDVDDLYAFDYPKEKDIRDEWSQLYSYTYELKVPLRRREDAFIIMQQDLQRYFDMAARVERRKVESFSLVKTGSVENLKTTGGPSVDRLLPERLIRDNDDTRSMRNRPFREFAERIGHWIEYHMDTPFLNEVVFEENIDVQLNRSTIDSFNIEALNAELARYKLAIIPSQKVVDVLIIQSKKKSQGE